MSSARKNSYIVCGEAGVGKSFYIRQEAKKHNAKLFRWNVRIDRSLREGREILHQQVRSKEPLYVWIEGADDLTQEAQAFLRRILETSSPNVISMLEVRESWKLSPPILSRCIPINMNTTQSFRSQKNISVANKFNLVTVKPSIEINNLMINDIILLRKNGADPIEIVYNLANYYNWDFNSTEMIKKIGAGYSPWLQLTYFLAVINRTKDKTI
jgi:DNA polymerase III delta prime subunit